MRFLALTNICSGDPDGGDVDRHPLLPLGPVFEPMTTDVERIIPDII